MTEMPETIVAQTLQRLTAAGKSLRPTGLIERLADKTGLALLDVRSALATLAARGEITGVARSGQPIGMVDWRGSRASVSVDADWQAAIAAHAPFLSSAERDTLAACGDLLGGLSVDDKTGVLGALLALRKTSLVSGPQLLSTELLLGSAKALRNLKRLARVLTLDLEEPSGEFYVLTAGSTTPRAVILIENSRCFTAFAKSPHAKESLAIAAYGYGLTLENFGPRLTAGQVIACPAYGERVDLNQVLAKAPALFWGDLDLEGLRIFESLVGQLPDVQLSAAYAHMDPLLDDPLRSHPYHDLFEKEGQRPPRGLTPAVRYLAARCALRAVDQEMLCRSIADVPLAHPYVAPSLSGAY
jgi:hypothetical protein